MIFFLPGLPPPHRLSGLYPTNPSFDNVTQALPFSQSSHGNELAHASPRASYSTPAYDLDGPNEAMQSSHSFAQASFIPDYQPQQQYPLRSLPLDEYDTTYNDQDSFLHKEMSSSSSFPRLSPAVAARERYMARKEAAGSAFAYGDGAVPSKEKRGCFSGKRKWWWLAGLLLIIAIAAAAAIAGILVSKKKSASNGVTGAVSSDSNDPSVFTKDPNLHLSFYGMCYTPLNAQYPACGDTIDSVIEDIQLISQLTTRLRLYGSDCDVTSLVLEAIQKTKVNMTIYPAAWLPQQSDDPQNVTYNRQVSEVQKAIETYGVDNIQGITVGNEFLLNGGSEAELIEKMADMRSLLASLNLSKTLPVGTADAGSMITTSLAQGSDYVMANVHPWFGGVNIDDAADWVYSYTANQEPSSALDATNDPKIYIAETGWPTNANESSMLTYEGAVAGVPELQTFLDNYICQANTNITNGGQFSSYFYFEAFDEPWKEIYGGVEPYWGLFNSNKTLKAGLVIPNCASP